MVCWFAANLFSINTLKTWDNDLGHSSFRNTAECFLRISARKPQVKIDLITTSSAICQRQEQLKEGLRVSVLSPSPFFPLWSNL